MQQEQSYDTAAWGKIIMLWLGACIGSVTLSQVVLFATLILTCLQIWKTWKELKRKEKQADAEEREKQQ